MIGLESCAPNCEICEKQREFDPYTRMFYCKYCEPEWHQNVLDNMKAERKRAAREEYNDTVMDHME